MDGDQCGYAAACHRPIDRGRNRAVVRRVIGLDAALPLGLASPAVARHHCPIRELHDERRVVFAAVDVDEEAREGGKDCRGAEPPRQRARQRRRPDIIGDVALEFRELQPEVAIGCRQPVAGVIAKQKEATGGIPLDQLVRGFFGG